MKLEFSRQIFEKKNSNIKFHENLSNGSRVVQRGWASRADGQAERHDKANSSFSEFCERA